MSTPETAFRRLIEIMNDLREQCPWDRKQTIQTLRHLTIEETYELADAISTENWDNLREELGDLLLHIVFYARIGAEEKKFSLTELINSVCDKLIARHPHIYGDVQVADADEVKKNWEKLKLKEGKRSVLGGVPASLPAMIKAMRIQDKSRQVGFEWETRGQVWEKVKEEMQELEEAVTAGEKDHIEDELGDVLFSLVNYARFLELDAEAALERTNRKFISRFTEMEKEATLQSRSLDDMSLEEMDALWNLIKKR